MHLAEHQPVYLTPDDGFADLRHLADALDRAVADGHGEGPGAPDLDDSEGVAAALTQLHDVIAALSSYTGTLHAHPVYGQCTKEQAARLQAMHLREHLPGLAAHMNLPH